MKEEDRNLIIKNIGEIIKDAKYNKIKVKNIEDFFCKILDCHDKIKEERDDLVLNIAKAGWDILLPYYNSISLWSKKELSIDTIEKKFSNKWIPFFAKLESEKFKYETIKYETSKNFKYETIKYETSKNFKYETIKYETIKLPTIQEEKEILPPITGSSPGSRTNSATTFRGKEGLTTNLESPPIHPK